MPYFIYLILVYLVLVPGSMLRMLRRSLRAPDYRRRWPERLGHYSAESRTEGAVVFHAVSVGEVHAAQPLLEKFIQAHPDIPLVLTTTTPTGSARARALFGSRLTHVYLPWELPGAMRRFYRHFQPRLLVLMETELWPVLISKAKQHRCAVVLANARLSEKSCRGYQQWLVRPLVRNMLAGLTKVAAQAESDARRFRVLGLAEERIQINGSLKFDVEVDQQKIAQGQALRQQMASRAVWIAASTRDGEDEQVLQAHLLVMARNPDALLVLVPRHPERFTEAGRLAESLGLTVSHFSRDHSASARSQVLIGDTMGDMWLYYALADVAFVGGSLVATGCQNIIEAAAMGLPVVTGPSLFNFRKAADLLLEAGAMQVVQDADELAAQVSALLTDSDRRQLAGRAAAQVVADNKGASDRLAGLLTEIISQS